MTDKPKAHKWRDGDGAFIRTRLVLEPMPTIAEGEQVPKKVRALPWGEIELRDKATREYWDEPGTLEVSDRTVTEVETNFAKRDTDFFVNLDHSFHGKAYGWIESVETVKDEGIYLSVDWTREGEDLVRDRAYRYSSIEAILDASAWSVDGSPAVVVAVTGLALTNDPAVVGQAPVAYQTLNAALSASDGREIEKRHNSPGDSGEKGVPTMSEGIFKGLFTGVFGREPRDDVDAAEMAAELKGYKEKYPQLTADLETATSKATELTEKLDEANEVISEFETANVERAEAEKAAKVETALTEGRISQSVAKAAKEDPETFLAAAEKTPKGTYSPPKGRQVTDKAIDSADTTDLGSEGDSASLDTEVKAHMAEHKVLYHEAWLAVKTAHAAAGKGV